MLRIHDEVFDVASPGLGQALASIYGTKNRPQCLCQPDGIAMYISKVAGKFAVKRMPNTGPSHHPDCDSYEPPAELSGLGQLLGSAIDENAEDGTTTLKLAFSLKKVAGKSAPAPGEGEKDSVKTDGNKLTLRGTLHYLWDQAGFNRWSPMMEGKRSWGVVRKYLLLAAENKMSKGTALAEKLYIPEPFSSEHKAELAQRRLARFTKVAGSSKETRHLMIVIAEVVDIAQSRFGFKIRFKHLPDCEFMMNADIHRRLTKRFATEIELTDSNSDNGVRLIAIATAGVSQTGVPSIEEIALMTVNAGWVPFEDQYELSLLNLLAERKRRYVKGLRYNLTTATPLAAAVLSDTGAQPTAIYLVRPDQDEVSQKQLNDLIDSSKLPSIRWNPSEDALPSLPPAAAWKPSRKPA